MAYVFGALAAGLAVFVVALGYWRTGNRAMARATAERIRSLRGFTVQDVYVSPLSLTGLAIDRERREVVLARPDMLAQMSIGAIERVEILEVEAPRSTSGRGERGVTKVVLRIVTDNATRPAHDIVLLHGSARARGIRRDDRRYAQARQIADAWKGQLLALKASAQR